MITLIQIYNEGKQASKQARQKKKKIQNRQFEEKRAPGNLMLEPRLVLKEIRDGLMGNGMKWGPQGRPHPAKLPVCPNATGTELMQMQFKEGARTSHHL